MGDQAREMGGYAEMARYRGAGWKSRVTGGYAERWVICKKIGGYVNK